MSIITRRVSNIKHYQGFFSTKNFFSAKLHLMIRLKRIYEPVSEEDGIRILVDRLWPRGIKKTEVKINEWIKDIAPSAELRKWFSHDISKWQEFRKRYISELEEKKDSIVKLRTEARNKTITFLFAARDAEHNNAVVLKELLQKVF